MIENTTSARSMETFGLLTLATGDTAPLIESQERQGQQQLVHSDRLPTDLAGDREAFEALGFTFGDPDPSDAMFAPATLPDGWKRESSDHAMWSYIVDQLGRRRASIFYKAAFYDRSATMSLRTLRSHLWDHIHDGKPLVTDDTWATPAAIVEEAREGARLAEENITFWAEHNGQESDYVAKYTAERQKFQAIVTQYAV